MSYLRETYFRVCINPHRSQPRGRSDIRWAFNCATPKLYVECQLQVAEHILLLLFGIDESNANQCNGLRTGRTHSRACIKLMMIIFNLGVSMKKHISISRDLLFECDDIQYLCSAEYLNCFHSYKVWWTAKLLLLAHSNYTLYQKNCVAAAGDPRSPNRHFSEVGVLLKKIQKLVVMKRFISSSFFLSLRRNVLNANEWNLRPHTEFYRNISIVSSYCEEINLNSIFYDMRMNDECVETRNANRRIEKRFTILAVSIFLDRNRQQWSVCDSKRGAPAYFVCHISHFDARFCLRFDVCLLRVPNGNVVAACGL